MLNEKRYLYRLSNIAGASLLLGSLILPVLLFFVLPSQGPAFMHEATWRGIVFAASGLLTLIPAALFGRAFLPQHERKQAFALGNFRKNHMAVVFLGVAACYIGNFAAAAIIALGSRAGVTFEGPNFGMPESIGHLLLMLFAIAVVPAIAEELLFRGVIMQPLRQFGDTFAVVCSAVLFGLIHGNMQQAPFAFLAGLVLGWAAIRCGGLFVPILIHFWNNAASMLLLFLSGRLSQEVFQYVQIGYIAFILLLGSIGLVTLYGKKKTPKPLSAPLQSIRPGPRALRYLFGSVPMVLSLLWFGYLIWSMIA